MDDRLKQARSAQLLHQRLEHIRRRWPHYFVWAGRYRNSDYWLVAERAMMQPGWFTSLTLPG